MPLEGGRCSISSLACATLGAYLHSGSLLLVTDLRCSVDVDIDIPAIVAIGWQSAGKSSLIEAISGIKLPRASGTCTRRVTHIQQILTCPTECQLEQAGTPWKCEVSLRFSHGADGNPLPTTLTVPFGPTITDKLEVTERIQRAQRAILNQSSPPDNFLFGAGTDYTKSEIPFSSNCIVLRISGSDVTDLNFIDLPGLFSGGQDNEMKLIRKLAVSYIQKPSCIILLTVACETDFVNQGAHRLAREHDPSSDRTTGVLTKPDRIPATEEENWLRFIRGDREETTWFCVKCPSTQAIDSGITWEQARAAESEFFRSTPPWSTLEDAYRQKLRTENLTACLSDKLCKWIADRLPDIQRDLSRLLEKTNQELKDLPPPPSSAPMSEILRLITEFTRAVEKQGEGEPGRDGLLQQIRPWQEKFRVAIRKTAPCFVPRFRTKPARVTSVPSPVCVEYGLYDASESPRPSDIELDDGKEIFIDDVLETAEWAVTRELPNNYPFIVQREYIIERVNEWDKPAQTLFNSIVEKLKEMTLCIIDTHFEHYTHGGLKERVCNIVTTHLELCAKETSKRIEFLLQVEREPSTQNKHYFKDYRRKFLALYKGLFHTHSNDAFIERLQGRGSQSSQFNSALDGIIANLAKIGFRDVKPLELAALQSSEEADDALKIMADVRAYFQVAFKRFVDNIPKAIDELLVLGLAKGLQDALVNGLGLDSPDAHERCTRLLAESPHIAGRRERLIARQSRLERAQGEAVNVLV
ncbi:P-loop containing nucleoside triphosphate hydrolase protein [Lactifluus subvellereus]|nr:P-loop containing nucleoside triphosphate hydrolase protein [Lactifluus subvellereus]